MYVPIAKKQQQKVTVHAVTTGLVDYCNSLYNFSSRIV